MVEMMRAAPQNEECTLHRDSWRVNVRRALVSGVSWRTLPVNCIFRYVGMGDDQSIITKADWYWIMQTHKLLILILTDAGQCPST